MDNLPFSELLREKRIAAGYSQAELADLLFMARASYNHFETGARIPTVDTLIRMSYICKVNPMEFLCSLIPEDIEEENPAYAGFLRENKYFTYETDTKFLSDYSRLSPPEKASISSIMNILNKTHSGEFR